MKPVEQRTLGQVAAGTPGAMEAMQDLGIDFVFFPDLVLGDVFRETRITPERWGRVLEQAVKERKKEKRHFRNWLEESPLELLDFLVDTYHSRLRNELPELSELLFVVMQVHGKRFGHLFDMHRLFNQLRTDLEVHLVREEEYVFPLLEQRFRGENMPGDPGELPALLADFEKDHAGAGGILRKLRALAGGYDFPEGICRTIEIAYTRLFNLERELQQHIFLENYVLMNRLKEMDKKEHSGPVAAGVR